MAKLLSMGLILRFQYRPPPPRVRGHAVDLNSGPTESRAHKFNYGKSYRRLLPQSPLAVAQVMG